MASRVELGKLPAGRHGLPREFVAQNQQMRIIDALAKVVAAKGYSATTVADVLSEAGVSRRTFYEHFRSKQDCFVTSIDTVMTGILHRVETAYEGDGPWSDRFRVGLAALLDIMHREPDFARMCMVESLTAGDEALAVFQKMLNRFEEFFEVPMAEPSHGKEFPPTLAISVVLGICGVLYRYLAAGRELELPGLLPDLVYVGEAPFIGPEKAAESATIAARQLPSS